MAYVNFDVAGFLKSWESMQGKMSAAGMVAWRNAVKEAWDAQREEGYQNKTGELTASMKWATSQSGAFGWKGELTTTAPHALYVDMGTKPHKIPGPGKGPSVFFWPKVGRWVTFTSQHPAEHPGTKAANFRAAAIQTFGQSAPQAIEKALAKAANDDAQ